MTEIMYVQDKSMMLWDLRVQTCQGLLKVPSGIPTAAFDQQARPLDTSFMFTSPS